MKRTVYTLRWPRAGMWLPVSLLIGGLLAYYLIFHGGNFKDHLQNLLHICMPILDGFILAWLMCPLVNAIEHFALYPARDWLISQKPSLQKKKKQLTSYCRGISIVLTLCFVLFLVYGFFRVVIPQIIGSIQSIAGQFPSYVKNVSDWAEKLLADNPDIETTVSDLIDHYSTDLENFLNKTMMPQINAIVKTVSLSMLSFAKAVWNLVIGLIISIYLLASKERFVSQGKKLLYAFWDTRQANVIMEDFRLIDSTFGGFISGKILDSAIIGVIAYIVLAIMKMPDTMLVAVIIGVTNIIPFFGPFIGAIPSFIIIVLQNPVQGLYFLIFVIILQQVDGNIIGPKILGDSTGLSSFWVVFAILVFGGLWGFPGMLLGVPIMAVIYYIVSNVVTYSLKKRGIPATEIDYVNLDRIDKHTNQPVYETTEKNKKQDEKSAGEA